MNTVFPTFISILLVNIILFLPGFIEFLLDRSVSFTKELKENKYDIVKRLSHSPAFDNNTVSRLQLYVEQGPFYSETEMQVATEEGD